MIINAITLYSVMQLDLVPIGQHSASDGHTPVVQFFVNVQILANKDREQAAILFGMLFTLIIWVFSALSLILAVLFYILYLWHHIRDGSLSRYCRRKIDTRLHKIVMKKVNKALAKDNDTRAKQGAKGSKFGECQADVKRQPTLPVLDNAGAQKPATVSRQTTEIDSSSLDSRTLTDVAGPKPTVPNMFPDPRRPEPLSRSANSSFRSNVSHESNAPLLNSASEMGYGGNGLPAPRGGQSRMDSEVRAMHNARPPPNRSFTSTSQSSQKTFNTAMSTLRPPYRQNSDTNGRLPLQPRPLKPMPRDMSFGTAGRPSGPAGFDPPTQEFEMHPPPVRANGLPSKGGYIAFNPHRQNNLSTAPAPVSVYSAPSAAVPLRNFTQPHRPPNDYFGSIDRPAQRSGTAPLPQANPSNTSSDDLYTGLWQQSFARPVSPSRPATATPGAGYGQRRPMAPRY